MRPRLVFATRVIAIVLALTAAAHATDLDPADRSAALNVAGRRLALVVGSSDYRVAASWPRLPNAVVDANALADELTQRYAFTVTRLVDAPMATFKSALRKLAADAGPADDVFVFVAGHGHFDREDNAGYLVFSDSAAQCGANCYAFDNVKRALYDTRARHVLVMFDVCYGGTFDLEVALDSGVVRAAPEPAPLRQIVRDYARYPSRFMIASIGAAKTSDGPPGAHSPFMTALLRVLAAPGPAGIVSLDRLYLALREGAGLPITRPTTFASTVAPHPSGTFLFLEDVGLCDTLDTLLDAGADHFTSVRSSATPTPADTPWATRTPATWLLPGARSCDVWHWRTDGRDELRCDMGLFDRALAEERTRETFRALRQCVADLPAEPTSVERAHGATEHRDLRLAMPSTGRVMTLSTVCEATPEGPNLCNVTLVIE